MQHKELADIRKFALITEQKEDFFAVIKPFGVDVYIQNGKIYDLYQNEINNVYLHFQLEKVLDASRNTKMVIVGVLTTPDNSFELIRYKHKLYPNVKYCFMDIKFVTYDMHFPVFDVDHVYKWRYDILTKVIGTIPGCSVATKETIKNDIELQIFVKDVFSIDTSSSVIVYKANGVYYPGESQLYFTNNMDTVSYSINVNQKYRAHIKKVVSTTLVMENGNKVDVALKVIAKFKKEFIDIPINPCNRVLQRTIWEHRKELKQHPFWFTGYTFTETENDKLNYVTIINEFLSFITATR